MTTMNRPHATTEDSVGDHSSDEEATPQQRTVLPEAVESFLGDLAEYIAAKNVPETFNLYENTFNKLTEKHYKNKKWPAFRDVEEHLNHDPVAMILYKELYFRHIYSKFNPTFEDRKGSWENYCDLLNILIENLEDAGDDEEKIELPAQWIWDLLDEFIYHYQTYCMFRNKAVKTGKESDIQKIKENPGVFETPRVFGYLHKLLTRSTVGRILASKGDLNKELPEFPRLVGYFALMQLLRMHSLLGDYRRALRTIEDLDFDSEDAPFRKVPACHITLYYYMGFAYLMMRRYTDSVRTFGDVLLFLSKGQKTSLSYQYDQMKKKQDQMYSLMLIGVALSPQRLDDALEKQIKEKHLEKQQRLADPEKCDLCFEELFAYACPKFVSPAPPDFEKDSAKSHFNQNEAHARQLKLFLQEVSQQKFLPTIRSYMNLYTALSTSKLAKLCATDEESLRQLLMGSKHKTRQLVRPEGAPTPLDGRLTACAEVEFFLDDDMVHISSVKQQTPYAEVFLRNIVKFRDLLRNIEKV